MQQFTNPRTAAEFDDWPNGRHRVKCKFFTEHNPKHGYRVGRQTQDKFGQWCKAKYTTYSGPCVIATGEDKKTYILRLTEYGSISIETHNFLSAEPGSLFHTQIGFDELRQFILDNYKKAVTL